MKNDCEATRCKLTPRFKNQSPAIHTLWTSGYLKTLSNVFPPYSPFPQTIPIKWQQGSSVWGSESWERWGWVMGLGDDTETLSSHEDRCSKPRHKPLPCAFIPSNLIGIRTARLSSDPSPLPVHQSLFPCPSSDLPAITNRHAACTPMQHQYTILCNTDRRKTQPF